MHGTARTLGAFIAVALGIGAAACTTYEDPKDAYVEQRFIATGEGTVRDDASGLLWAANANLPGFANEWDGYSWQQALEYVSAMNAGERPNLGKTDWRLPHVGELAALLAAFNRPANTAERRSRALWMGLIPVSDEMMSDSRRVQVRVFVNVQENAYWSGTAAAPAGENAPLGSYTASASQPVDASGRAWVVDLNGAAYPLDKSARKRVWPVSGGPTATTPR